MSGISERLSAALADRYRIERELGAGGMATVYLPMLDSGTAKSTPPPGTRYLSSSPIPQYRI